MIGSFRSYWPAASLVALASLCVACGDDIPSNGGTDTEGSTGTSSADGSPTSASTSPPPTTTTDPSTTGADSTGTDSSGGPGLEVDVQVVTYASQPMVVDLVFSAPDLTVTANHTTDAGVHIATIDPQGDETRVRVRGLAPATLHAIDWNAENAEGLAADGQQEFTTEAPLPGFVPSFDVTGDATGLGGYVLFDLMQYSPVGPTSMFVVDEDGVTRWHYGVDNDAFDPAVVHAAVTLRDDGTVLFQKDYEIRIIDELGGDVFTLDSATIGVPGLHHEVIELDNGNFLTMSYTFQDVNYPGPGTTYVAGDLLLEVTPAGDIVWQWNSFDHLDPLRTRAGFEAFVYDPDTMQLGQDWTHGNGLVYDEVTDTVLFSMRHQDWMVNIDRVTGNILWRFGEEGDFTLASGTWQFHQHSPQWQADGTLLLYDNGLGNPNLDDALETSRAVRYSIDEMTMTVDQVWEDEAEDFVAPIAGDVARLPDDSILVLDSSIDLGTGMGYARLRKIEEASSATPQWTLQTGPGTFAYRNAVVARWPGETG